MEFNKNKRNFKLLREVNLASVPTINDKVVIDIKGIVYKLNFTQ